MTHIQAMEQPKRVRRGQARRMEIRAPLPGRFDEILTPDALGFVEALVDAFGATRDALLARRSERQRALDAGVLPDFLEETRAIRESAWTVAAIPDDLMDRRVEITGPVERKMIINALSSGANVFMADLEDATSPTWENVIQGQVNLCDAVRRSISFTSAEGKHYTLGDSPATLMVRPRGWHLDEKHVLLDGRPVPASLFDFGLYFFHNARELVARGSGPYFYLPKLESHLEARLWNEVFVAAQDMLGIARGTIRATVLIETILAAFEMDEILYELREHSAGLNCGRWDYIFSIIKKLGRLPDFVLPDRAQVTMTTHAMRSYSLLAIQTCHRRGIHAIGGMAAQIPVRRDAEANARALAKVREDKEREAGDGHDGTWVAHPGLVSIARAAFDARLAAASSAGQAMHQSTHPAMHQIARKREDVQVTAADLLAMPPGTITENGLRHNLDVAIRYLGAWLAGIGCVPIYHLMEDAATAEISRAQVWQWVHHPGGVLEDGRKVTAAMIEQWLDEELSQIHAALGPLGFAQGRYEEAAALMRSLTTQETFPEFMTSVAYEHLD